MNFHLNMKLLENERNSILCYSNTKTEINKKIKNSFFVVVQLEFRCWLILIRLDTIHWRAIWLCERCCAMN